MTYVFRWRCLRPALQLQVTITAPNDLVAGELAAAALHDFVKGRRRELAWEPLPPLTLADVAN